MSLKIKNNKTIVLDLSKGHGSSLSESDFSSNADEIASGGNFLGVVNDAGATFNLNGQVLSYHDQLRVNLTWDDVFESNNSNPKITWKPFYSPDGGNFGIFLRGLETFTETFVNVYIDVALTGKIQSSTIMDFIQKEWGDLYEDFGPEVELLVTALCSVQATYGTTEIPGPGGVPITVPVQNGWDWGAALNSQTLRDSLNVVAPHLMNSEIGQWINSIISSFEQGDISPLINQTLQEIPWVGTAVNWLNGINSQIMDYLVFDNISDVLLDKLQSELKFNVSDIPKLAELHNQYAVQIQSDPYNTQIHPDVFKHWIQEKIDRIGNSDVQGFGGGSPFSFSFKSDGAAFLNNTLTSANSWVWNFFESQAGAVVMDNLLTFAVDKLGDFVFGGLKDAIQLIGAELNGIDYAMVPSITNIEIIDELGNRITSGGMYLIDGSFNENITTRSLYGEYIDTFIFDKADLIFDPTSFKRELKSFQQDTGVKLGSVLSVKVDYVVAEYAIGTSADEVNHISFGTQDFLIKLSELSLGDNDKIVLDVAYDIYDSPEVLGDSDKLKITSPDNANVDTVDHLGEMSSWQSSDNYVKKTQDKVVIDVIRDQGDPSMKVFGQGFMLEAGQHNSTGGGYSGPGIPILNSPVLDDDGVKDFYFLSVDSVEINGVTYKIVGSGNGNDPQFMADLARTREILKVIHFEDIYAGAGDVGKLAIKWDRLDSLMKYLNIEIDEDATYEFKVNYKVVEVYEADGTTYSGSGGIYSDGNFGSHVTFSEVDFDYININYGGDSDIIDYDETLTVGADSGTLYQFDNFPEAGDQSHGDWGTWGEDSNGNIRIEVARNTLEDNRFEENLTAIEQLLTQLGYANLIDQVRDSITRGVWFNTTRSTGLLESKTLEAFFVRIGDESYFIDGRDSGINLATIVPSPEPENPYKEAVVIDKAEIIRILKDVHGIVLHDGVNVEIDLTYVMALTAIDSVGSILGNLMNLGDFTNESSIHLTLKGEGVQKVLMANSELVKVNYSDNSITYDANVITKNINELASEVNPEYLGNPVANNSNLITVDVLANDLNTTLVSQVKFTNDADNLLSQITIKFSDGRADLTLTGDNFVYIENNKIVVNSSAISSLIPNFDKGLIAKINIDYTIINPTQDPSAATLEFLMQADGLPFQINDEELTMKEKDGIVPSASPVLAHNAGPDTTRIHIYKNDSKGYEFQSFQFEDDASSDAGYQVVAHVHKVFSGGMAYDFDIIIDADVANAIKAYHSGNDLTKYYVDINRKSVIDQIMAKNPQLGAWKINDGDTVTLDIKYGVTYKDAFGNEVTDDAILKINILGQSDILPLKANNEHVFITEETYDINADVYNDPTFQEQIAWYEGENLVVNVRANDSTQGSFDTVNIAGLFIQGQVFKVDVNGNVTPAMSLQMNYSDLESQGIIFINSDGMVELDKMALIEYLNIEPFFDGDRIELNINYYLTSSGLVDVFPTPKSNIATLKVTLDGDGAFTAVTDADETIGLFETNNLISQFSNIAQYINNDIVKIDLSANTVYHNAVLEDYQITYITAKLTKAGQVIDITLPQSIFQQVFSGNDKFYLQANRSEILDRIMQEIMDNPAFANLSDHDQDFNTGDTLQIKVGYRIGANSITDNYSPTDESTLTINISGKDKLIIDESEEIIVNENDTSIISSTVIEADDSLVNPGVDVSYIQGSIQNAIKIEVADNATLSGASISGLVVTNCVALISQANGSINGYFVLDDSFYDVHTSIHGTYITLNKQKLISLAGGEFNFHAGDTIEVTVNYDLTAQTGASGGISGLIETLTDHSHAKIIINGEGGPISITGEEAIIINELIPQTSATSSYGTFDPFEHVWEVVNGTIDTLPTLTPLFTDAFDDDITNIDDLVKFEIFDGNKLRFYSVDPDRLAQIVDKDESIKFSFILSYGGVSKTITIDLNGKKDSILPIEVLPQAELHNGDSITINLKDYVNDFEIDPTKSSHDDTTLDNFIMIDLIDPATNTTLGSVQGVFDHATGEVTIDSDANGVNGTLLQGLAAGDYIIRLFFHANSSYQGGDFDDDKKSFISADIKFIVDNNGNGNNPPEIDLNSTFPDTTYEESELSVGMTLGSWDATDSDGSISYYEVEGVNILSDGLVGVNFNHYFEVVKDSDTRISVKIKAGADLVALKGVLDSMETGTVTVHLKAIDNLGAASIETVVITINGADGNGGGGDPTVDTSANTFAVEENDGASDSSSGVVGSSDFRFNLSASDDVTPANQLTYGKVGNTVTVSGVLPSGTSAANFALMLDSILTVNHNGEVIFNTSSANGPSKFDYLKPGDSATVTFNFTVTDSDGNSTTSTSTIAINGTNDGPVAYNIAGPQFTEDQLISFNLTVTDVDQGDTHTFEKVPGYIDINGSGNGLLNQTDVLNAITVNPDGTVTVDNSVFQALGATHNVTIIFKYKATDLAGAMSEERSVTFSVTGLDDMSGNDAPTANSLDVTHQEGAIPSGFQLVATDPDGDALTYTFSNLDVSISSGTISPATLANIEAAILAHLNTAGNFNASTGQFSLPNSIFNQLNLGQNVLVNFNYTVDDGNGGVDHSTANITIQGKDGNGSGNGPNIDTSANTFVVDENDGANDSSSGVVGSSDFRFNLSATDDVTPVNQLVYAKSGAVSVSGTLPSGMNAADFASMLNSLLTVSANGQVTFNTSSANGPSKFDYLKSGASAAVTFNFTVTDSDGNITTSTSTITINGTNDAPVASNVVIPQQFTEDQFINFNLTVSDVDQGDTHVFTKIPGFIQITGSGSTLLNQTDVLNAITVNPDGTVTVNNAAFQDLTQNKSVTVTFQYKASDGVADTGIKTATFNVSGLNDFIGNNIPVANIFEATYQENNIPSSLQLVASDPDGDALVYYFDDIDVTVASGTISPSVLSDIKMAVIVHLNAMGNFNINNGQFSLPNSIFSQLNLGQNVLVKFNYEVNDGKGGVAHNTAKITINGLDGSGGGNTAPDAFDAIFSVNEDDQFNFDISGSVNDPDVGDTVTYHLEPSSIDVIPDGFSDVAKINTIKAALNAAGAVTVNSSGVITISQTAKNIIGQQLNNGENIDIKFNYFAKDNHDAESGLAEITIKIEGENENAAPTAIAVNETFWEDDTIDVQLVGNDVDGTISEYMIDMNSITVKKENGANASAQVLADVKAMIQAQLSDIENNGHINLDNSYFEPLLGHNQSFKISFNYKVMDDDGALSNSSAKADITINGKSPNQLNNDELWVQEDSSSLSTDVLLNDVIDSNGHSYTVYYNMDAAITLTIEQDNQITTKQLTASEWNPFVNYTGSVDASGLSNYLTTQYGIDIGVNEDGYADQIRFNMNYIVKDDITMEVLGSANLAVFIDGVNN